LIDALVSGGHGIEALHYVERAKTRLLVGQLHWRSLSDAGGSTALDRCVRIMQRLAFLELAAGAGATAAHAAERAALEKELDNLRGQIPERELMAVLHPSIGTAERTMEIVKELLGKRSRTPGEVILAEYMIIEDSILLFVMRENFKEPVVFRIDRSARDVTEFVTRHLQLEAIDDATESTAAGEPERLTDPDAFRAFGAPLVAPLVATTPMGDALVPEGAVICFVPHGGLHYLPLTRSTYQAVR
jgi:hypothetical protein